MTRVVAHVVYGLLAAGFFTSFLTSLVGVTIAHVKRSDARGSSLEEHFRWQIRTFWFALSGFVLLLVASAGYWLFQSPADPTAGFPALQWFFVPMAFALALAIWYLYRIVKGWLCLVEERGVYGLKHP